MPQLPADITTTDEAIEASASRYGSQNAIRFLQAISPAIVDSTVSYDAFFRQVNQSARLLQKMMKDKRGVVSILAPNIPQNHALLWAAESIGIANPLNPLLNEDALCSLMEAAATDVIVALGPNPASDIWEKAQAVAERLSNKPQCVSILTPGGELFYDEMVNQFDDAPLPASERPSPTDIAAYFHTGGTTGLPKLAMHTHDNQMTAGRVYYNAVFNDEPDIAINGMPMFHVAGAMVMALGGIVTGAEQILPTVQGFRNPEIINNHWRLIDHYGVTVSGGIPTSVASMMGVPVGENDLSSLRFMVSGGSTVPAPLVDEVKRKIGKDLHQIYGMTESAGAVTMPNTQAPAIAGAAGYLNPGLDVKIATNGEVCLKGPNVFPGYLGVNKTPLDDDGWFHTGDLGHIDNNYLFITGRAKDLIIRSGHNIDPALIESCLDSHPAVAMSAAVGKPDQYAGELPVAYVQLHPNKNCSIEELQQYVFDNIAERPANPKQIFILDEIPVTAVGKIHKPTLREMAAKTLALETLEADAISVPAQLDFSVLKSGKLNMICDSIDKNALNRLTALASELEWEVTID